MGIWACGLDGSCEFLRGIDISKAEVLECNKHVRLFRLVDKQADNMPQHILQWGERRGRGMTFWSIQCTKASPPRINTGRPRLRFVLPVQKAVGARKTVKDIMRKLATEGFPTMMKLGYRKVEVVEDKPTVAIWRLIPYQKCVRESAGRNTTGSSTEEGENCNWAEGRVQSDSEGIDDSYY